MILLYTCPSTWDYSHSRVSIDAIVSNIECCTTYDTPDVSPTFRFLATFEVASTPRLSIVASGSRMLPRWVSCISFESFQLFQHNGGPRLHGNQVRTGVLVEEGFYPHCSHRWRLARPSHLHLRGSQLCMQFFIFVCRCGTVLDHPDVGYIELARPSKFNAFSGAMWREFPAAVRAVEALPSVRVVRPRRALRVLVLLSINLKSDHLDDQICSGLSQRLARPTPLARPVPAD